MTDQKFEEMLKGAYDGANPTPEQEERMLASLVEAQAAEASQSAEDEVAKPETSPAPNRAKGFKVWKVALPLAACLAVGAVIIGVAGNAQTASAPVLESSAAVSEAAVQQDAKVTNDAQPTASSKAENRTLETEELAADGTLGLMATADGAAETALIEDGYPYPGDSAYTEFNTEEYNAIKEGGFVSTKANPLSTVSADVDTASYCNLRRMINDGSSIKDIPSGAVRIEEMLNYFDYDYAKPQGNDLFSIQAQSAQCPWNEDTQLLVLGFATAPESQAASKGSNLVFLIDVSGSMDSPDKLDLLQDSFATLLESLGPNDRVSIVTYASGEEIVLEGASGDDDKAILKAIYKLHASGSTNGEAGLQQAYEVAQRNFIEGGVNRIIMASDGDLNVGISSESDLYDFVDGKRDTGIYLSVLGFGWGNYKDNKMETLADHGNGSYHYIDSIEEAERVLKQKLTANLVPFADNVKVQVEFNPGQVKAYRLIGYENRELADEDFRNDAVDAGDVGPGSQFTVAYEVVLADSKMQVDEPELKYGAQSAASSSASGEWLTCSMRYHAFDGDEMREQQLEVGPSQSTSTPDANWNLAAAVIEFGMMARDSDYAGTSSEDQILELLAGAAQNEQATSFARLVASAFHSGDTSGWVVDE